jgi:hypothetical protein
MGGEGSGRKPSPEKTILEAMKGNPIVPTTQEPIFIPNYSGLRSEALKTSSTSFGNTTGASSSTDKAIVRFDGTTGKTLQNSGITISDTDVESGCTQLNVDNIRVDGNDISTTNTNGNLTLTPNGTGKVAPAKSVNFGAFTAYFTETDNGNSGTSKTIDWTTSNKQKVTMTGNCTFTFTAPPGPCNLVFKMVQDATGSRTATWPSAVHWSGGTAPTLTTTANKVDIIVFYYDGSTYFGTSSLNYTA